MGEPTAAEAPLTVLVVDDEETMVRSCARILENEGFEVHCARRAREALELARRVRPAIVLSDVMLPDLDGMALLNELRDADPSVLVILITGYATVDASIRAIRAGAYDYIPKPFSATQLQILIGRAASQVRLARDNQRLREELRQRDGSDGMICGSAAMQRVREVVRRVAPTDASVFITGESGTGKELVARMVHQHSRRADRAFVPVNCAAFPEHLLESELFGHEKGAFTGADQAKRGLLEYASGGTFFLDELCEMSQDLQAKLLRVLQERRIRRVGGEAEIPIDIRIVAATNRDPARAVDQGVLRQDLYFRVNVVPITVPPLRDRPDDVTLLAQHFLRRYAERYERDGALPLRLSQDALRALRGYEWPGNVRQLQNLMERVASLALPGQEIGVVELPEEIIGVDLGLPSLVPELGLSFHEAKDRVVEAFERAYLQALLERHDGNISQAARQAEIDRKTIHRLLRKHGLQAQLIAAGD